MLIVNVLVKVARERKHGCFWNPQKVAIIGWKGNGTVAISGKSCGW